MQSLTLFFYHFVPEGLAEIYNSYERKAFHIEVSINKIAMGKEV